MTASGVRVDDAMGTAGNEEGVERLRRGIGDRSREQGVGESIWLWVGCKGRVGNQTGGS